ncbi:aa3-type cytochrome oxidase subunit CtaJ [Parasphingorhabdus pacifica]
MTVVETFLVLAGIPAAIYGLVALITLWPKLARSRKRSGQEWDFAPVFWVADPAVVSSTPPKGVDIESGSALEAERSTARGGARGNW